MTEKASRAVSSPLRVASFFAGIGGFDLHRWHSDREQGGRVVDKAWADSLLRPRGAYLMGRNMFSPVRGAWSSWEDECAARRW